MSFNYIEEDTFEVTERVFDRILQHGFDHEDIQQNDQGIEITYYISAGMGIYRIIDTDMNNRTEYRINKYF